jgi:hypothetical protein
MTTRLFLKCIMAFILTSCGPHQERWSKLSEAPDIANLRSTFGITQQLTWDKINANLYIELDQTPWTDSYWPLVNKEMAARWFDLDLQHSEEVGYASFLKTNAIETSKDEPNPGLSPAEKYDLAFQLRHQVAGSATEVNAVAASLEAIDKQIRDVSDITSKRPLLRSLIDVVDSSELSKSMSMTTYGWKQFLYYSSDTDYRYLGLSDSEGESWGWMGICHGWAAAALMSKAPLHGAMAIIGNKKILFSEGDIRGLLSRAWAQQAPHEGSYFLGRRCNDNVADPDEPIPSNSRGKGYAGTVTVNGAEESFVIVDSLLNLKVQANGYLADVYKIQIDGTDSEKILIFAGNLSYMAQNFGDVAAYMRDGNISRFIAVESKLTGCWDVNPASFHEVLVEQLAVRKTGFVMDRTRQGQVWNQPVFGADFFVGDLMPVGSTHDVAAQYRASGTAYLAEVTADVFWIAEPRSPQLVYGPNYDAQYVRSITYSYTLEFDSNKKLIGGEWGTLTEMDPVAEVPDFLYGYASGSEPVDNLDDSHGTLIDYSGIIKRLLECSRSDTIHGTRIVNGHSISYSECPIEKL